MADQGIGALTQIDVKATLKAKLGEDIEDYLILGACNPRLAHRAIDVDRQIGLMLPCNTEQGRQTVAHAHHLVTPVEARLHRRHMGLQLSNELA